MEDDFYFPIKSGRFGLGNFDKNKKSIYIGLMGNTGMSAPVSTPASRPDQFIGLRFDTSTVPVGMAITSVASGTGVYTGTINGTTNSWVGQNITFKNFSNPANNGTFVCTANTTTTITVSNASSVAEAPTNAVAVLASIPLTAAANASGGTTAYTMPTGIVGTTSSLVGISFVVTGFVNGANNGTFTCTANTTTSLTLNNPSGVAETHAGFATGGSINDSFWTLEAVGNTSTTSNMRHNLQGTTLVTNLAPIAGVWHRLDIVCSATGMVTITLDGTNTLTVPLPKVTLSGSITGSAANGVGVISWNTGVLGQTPWGAGSKVTVTGFTGAQLPLNSTWELLETSSGIFHFLLASSIGSNSPTGTLSGFPTLIPVFGFGNDDSGSPFANSMSLSVDYWSLVWNPKLGPSAPGTPDPTKPRYW